MWLRNEIFYQDMQRISLDPSIDWDALEGRNILITGATGLIGFTLISSILYYGMSSKNPPRVIALVRNLDNAKQRFSDQLKESSNLNFILGDVSNLPNINEPIDFIIHGASVTASKAFVDQPVETIQTALHGTENLLNLARSKQVKGMVYLSSMEIYGFPQHDNMINEDEVGAFNTMIVRNSYPLSKCICEGMCQAYHQEYGVKVNVARLTQTFGPGVEYNDSRVFAEFVRCAIEGRDIILHTIGETKRSYLYTSDAAAGILIQLLRGEAGKAYNIANESSYCSILEMAHLVAKIGAEDNIKVKVEIQDADNFGYAPVLKMNLDTTRLRNLGWQPTTDLTSMYQRLIDTLRGK